MVQLIGRTYPAGPNAWVSVFAYRSEESGNVSWRVVARSAYQYVTDMAVGSRSEAMAFVRGFTGRAR